MLSTRTEGRPAVGRDRLLATARELFTSRGASNVGINEVTAAAGVARMTLYNNFPSKDALVSAVYQEMVDVELEALTAIERDEESDERAILAVFDHFHDRSRNGVHRGCPFIHASLQTMEPPGAVHAIVHLYKQALRDHLHSLLDPRRVDRAELADQMLLLLDGAMIGIHVGAVADPITAAKRAASALLRSGRVPVPSRRRKVDAR